MLKIEKLTREQLLSFQKQIADYRHRDAMYLLPKEGVLGADKGDEFVKFEPGIRLVYDAGYDWKLIYHEIRDNLPLCPGELSWNDYAEKLGDIILKISDDIEDGSRTKPAKLFAKYFKEEFGEKLGQATLSQVGQVFNKYSSEAQKEVIGFFVSELYWKPGDFGDGGSCYWGSYAGARHALNSHPNTGSFVSFIKEPGDDKFYPYFRCHFHGGRVKYVGNDETDYVTGLLLFNGYRKFDSMSTVKLGSYLAKLYGLKSSRVGILNNWSDTDCDVYINGERYDCPWDDRFYGRGVMIAERKFMDKMKDIETSKYYIVNLEIEYRSGYVCTDCGDYIPAEEVWEHEGYAYCESCFHERFFRCDHCDDYFDRDYEHVTADEYHLCEGCFDEYTTRCSSCGDVYYYQELEEVDGVFLCDDCIKSETVTCEHCGDRTLEDNSKETDDAHIVCFACYEWLEKYRSCDNCGEVFFNEAFLTDTGSEELCSICLNKQKQEA